VIIDLHTATLDDFLGALSKVPWCANLGRPHPRDASARRISSWDEWHGSSPEADYLGAAVGELRKVVMAGAPAELERLFEEVFLRTAQLIEAAGTVPAEEETGNVDFGPNTCLNELSYQAAVIACFLERHLPLPWWMLECWQWVEDGHYPWGCTPYPEDGVPLLWFVF
jgi:hypothetical protein